MEPTEAIDGSLSESLQDYLALFAIGLAAGVAIGLVISFIWDLGVADAIGLTIGLFGGVMLATGGASGGGYRNMKSESGDRLTTRPRNEVTPKSVLQVGAGLAYLAIGIGLAVIFG